MFAMFVFSHRISSFVNFSFHRLTVEQFNFSSKIKYCTRVESFTLSFRSFNVCHISSWLKSSRKNVHSSKKTLRLRCEMSSFHLSCFDPLASDSSTMMTIWRKMKKDLESLKWVSLQIFQHYACHNAEEKLK